MKFKNINWLVLIVVLLVAAIIATTISNRSKKNELAKTEKELDEMKTKSFESQPLLIDINILTRRSPDLIKEILGKPDKIVKTNDCGNLKEPCYVYHYKKDSIMIMYEQNQAVYFDFEFLSDFKFGKPMPEIFGYEPKEPEILKGNDVYWYRNYTGIRNMSFIESKKKPGFIDYVIIELK